MPLPTPEVRLIRSLAVIVGIATCLPTLAQHVEWTALGPGGSGDASAMVACGSPLPGKNAMALGKGGSIVATGCGYNGSNNDFLTVKYSPDGSVLWSARYNGPADGEDSAYALALDSAGDVFVTGVSAAVGGGLEFATVKYAGDSGALRWVARYSNPGATNNTPSALAVDPSGDVLVTGTSSQGASHFATVKYAGRDGALQWEARFDGPVPGNAFPYALAVDAAGDVLVAGISNGDFATVKYAGASGVQRWNRLYDGPASEGDFAAALALDRKGDVMVVGASTGAGSGFDYATIKYAGANGAQQWVARYSGPANLVDQALAVAVDAADNVLVTGASTGVGSGFDYATVKYAGGTGAQQWVSRHDGPAHAYDVAYAIATDATGDVLVAGWSNAGASDNDYLVIKYSGELGAELWLNRYDGPAHRDDDAYALAVDNAGDVVVAGRTHDGVQYDFGIGKFAGATGAPVWFAHEPVHSGLTENLACGGYAQGKHAVAVDSAGNTVAVGCAYNGRDRDYQIVKFSPQGSLVWSASYDGPAGQDDLASAIAIDTVGDVIVTGRSTAQGSGPDYTTVKFAGSTGTQLWASRYTGPVGFDEATVVTVDSAGDVLVTGTSEGFDGYDVATVKYAGVGGAQLWVNRYTGPAGGDDAAVAMAIDGAGNLAVTGYSSGIWGLDYLTIKYAGASGQRLWTSRYDGPVGEDDQALDLAVDGQGNVVVTGWSKGVGRYDYATIKLAGTNGDWLWVSRYDTLDGGDDFALAVAVDKAGDAYVSGLSRTGANGDFLTFKYAGATGETQWKHQYDGPAHQTDLPADVAIDRAGDVWVTGYSTEPDGFSTSFATVKLAGADGRERWRMRESFGTVGRHQALALDVAADGSIRVSGSVASTAGARIGVLRIDDAPPRMFADGFEGAP